MTLFGFKHVFHAELDAIRKRHNGYSNSPIGDDTSRTDPSTALELSGIACSGGGIRSASFCLGVLQGLQSKGTLDRMDYVSTVSGGGYIGTTMTIGMSSHGDFPFGRLDQENRETPEVRHLRDNSRYLIQNGLPSVVSALVIYLRGIMMNALTVLPLLLCAAAFLLLVKPSSQHLVQNWFLFIGPIDRFDVPDVSPVVIVCLFLIICIIGYAVAVSVLPIKSLAVRQKGARLAGWIFAIAILALVVELHTVLLRLALEARGYITPTSTATPEKETFIDFIFSNAKTFVLYVSPFVLPILPFLKGLISKATTGESASWSGYAGKLTSRALLLFAAAIVPILLWLGMMQFAYWGTEISAAAAPGGHCTPDHAGCSRWPQAPAFLQGYFAATASFRGAVSSLLCIAAVPFLFWPFLSVNANSLHQLYRDRLGRAFLIKRKDAGTPDNTVRDEVDPADGFLLSEIAPQKGPYHLINAALNVPGSRFANRRGRNADFFLFSQRYIGSEATGYVDTKSAEAIVDGLNIGTAMAISGAAAAPNMGMASIRPLSATIALLNIRLGRWIRHPSDIQHRKAALDKVKAKRTTGKGAAPVSDPVEPHSGYGPAEPEGERMFWRIPRPKHLLYEAFSKTGRSVARLDDHTTGDERGFVFLTDGGHIDNLGIYELLRRRCKLIIAIDGEADSAFDSGSLVQVERFARIDLNVRIRLNWEPIGIRTRAIANEIKKGDVVYEQGPHVALGSITYPPTLPGGKAELGVLVYIKASLSGDEADYVLSYKKANPHFPHETTMDQLFSEEQFEAYRALGEHIARGFVDGRDGVAAYPNEKAALLQMVTAMLPNASPR